VFGFLKKVQDAARRAAVGTALIFIACLVALTAAGFAIAALYQVLEDAFSSEVAAAITAVILLVLAGIIALIGASAFKAPKKHKRNSGHSHAYAGAAVSSRHKQGAATEIEMAQRLIAGGRWSPLAMALIAGFAFGASPELRKELARLLRHEAEKD
jgi:uncharacterized membrane protein YidH (DUF202 family)